jgi:hypothetical protein
VVYSIRLELGVMLVEYYLLVIHAMPCHAKQEQERRTEEANTRPHHETRTSIKTCPKSTGRAPTILSLSRTRRARPSARAHQGQLHAAAIFLGRCRHRACTGAAGVGAAGQQGPVLVKSDARTGRASRAGDSTRIRNGGAGSTSAQT